MDQDLIDDIHKLLKQRGFEALTQQRSTVSQTLAGQHGDYNVVVHLSKAGTVPTSAATPHAAAARGLDIAVKATFPGLDGPVGIEALTALRQGGGSTVVNTR